MQMQIAKDAIQKLKSFMFARQHAYQLVFNPKSVFAQRVLADLEKFCRGNTSTFHEDPRAHALMEGRREVWLRITDAAQLPPDLYWEKYGRKDLES